jgi:hypothetical protein
MRRKSLITNEEFLHQKKRLVGQRMALENQAEKGYGSGPRGIGYPKNPGAIEQFADDIAVLWAAITLAVQLVLAPLAWRTYKIVGLGWWLAVVLPAV